MMLAFGSFLIGAVAGLICVAIFAVILRKFDEKKPKDITRALVRLLLVVMGSGLSDYVVFDAILKSDKGIEYYMIGLAVVFLPLGLWVLIDWLVTR